MARSRVVATLGVATLLLTAAPASAGGVRAHLRVLDPAAPALGARNPSVGAARAFLAADGTPQPLPRNTVLGQLVSATGWWGVDLSVQVAQLGAYVSSIDRRVPGANGFWALYVDGVAASEGAGTLTMKRGQEIVWILDQDYTKPGPFFLDLDLVARRGRLATFHVTRSGGAEPVDAAGAKVRVGARTLVADAGGRVRVRLPAGGWTARATLADTVPSEILGSDS